MTAPIDLLIHVEHTWQRAAPKWRVAMESVVGRTVERVEPLRDEDLRRIADVPPNITTWRELATHFAPGAGWMPTLPVMKAVGQLLSSALLDRASFERHFADIEQRAREEQRTLRVIFSLEPLDDEEAATLPWLPLEMAHDGREFRFKAAARGAMRCDPRAGARNLAMRRWGVALLATAHDDRRPPSRDALEAHRMAVASALEASGMRVVHLPDATARTLESALLHAAHHVDLLYLACHGHADPANGGQLALRDGLLSGERLGQWLDEAARTGRPLEVAMLCACSSAAPQIQGNTSGMAQWLAQEGRATVALGFRGPVGAEWALRFVGRVVERATEAGRDLERAFLEERAALPNEDPSWTLPQLYVRRGDPGAAATGGVERPRVFRGGETEQDAVRAFAQRAWGDRPGPDVERDAAEMVERLGGERTLHMLAASTIAAEQLSAVEFVQSVAPAQSMPSGAWAGALLDRSLAGLPPSDTSLFLALCGGPPTPADASAIARQVQLPEPVVSAKLFRLAGRGLLVARGHAYLVPTVLRNASHRLATSARRGSAPPA